MQAERWKQVEELFEAAQQEPADQRAQFLRKACGGDDELCAEVEALLKAADSGDALLDGSPLSSIAERALALRPGDKLGSFEIVAMLGRGGMGEVYRARDLRLKREVAIKTLPSGFAGDRDRIARFEREARAASALNHPNIVAVFDVGHEGDVSFIVSELVEGETLATLLERGPLPLRKLIDVGTQICEGLAAAHAAGVVHRDLKPGNIMLNRDGRVKILDFGLARQDRVLGAESSTMEVSHPGVILGTAGYMSPEQVRGEATDARSDMFSLGLVLYEMASGKRAFSGNSSIEVMNAILKDDPPELPQASPPTLDRIVRRCLEKQPQKRFQSAADLGFALASLSSPLVSEPVPKSRARLKWAAAGLACLVVVAGAYWLGTRTTGPAGLPQTTFRRLTNDPGLTADAAISSDGKLIAYASDRADSSHLDIWVQQVDGSGVVRITDDAANHSDPAFSPDSTQIAFRSERAGGGIYIAPTIGGEARLVIPQGKRPRFSPDGQKLLYWTGPGGQDVRGSSEDKVWVRSIAGGEATQIGQGCRLFFETAVWSPDGSRILFVGTCGSEAKALDSQPENYGLTAWISSVDGKDLRPNRELYGPLWRTVHSGPVIAQWIAHPSRLLIPLMVGDASSINTVPVSADGTRVNGPLQRLAFAGGTTARLSAAFNGRIALSAETSETHIWAIPIDSKGSATGVPKQVTYGRAGESSPSLSADGEKLAFLSQRANGMRLFYKDLATSREKEVSTEGYRYAAPVFNHDGTKIMCVQYPKPDSWRNFVFEITIAGGFSGKVWDKSTWSWVYDWSPDDSTVLLLWEPVRNRRGVQALDLSSGATTTYLAANPEDLGSVHFSHDGRWVVFTSTPWMEFYAKPSRSRIFAAPFRKTLVPRSEWIPITDDNLDFDPNFSYSDKLIAFVSERDGFPCIWAQKLRADMHPDGTPFPVYHSHDRRRVLREDQVGPHAIVFERTEMSGNIWLLEPAEGSAK